MAVVTVPVRPPRGAGAGAAAAPSDVNAYTPGTDTYDWWEINQVLRDQEMNGWQLPSATHSPVNIGQTVKNPDWAEGGVPEADARLNQGKKQYITIPGETYVITATDPNTKAIRKITLVKVPDPSGSGRYRWQATAIEQEIAPLDARNQGYSSVQRLPFQDGHQEIWGVNMQTGAFEKLPDQPTGLGDAPPGWTGIKLVDQPDGSQVWMGVPPPGVPEYDPNKPGIPVPVPGWKSIPGDGIHTNIRQVTEGGKKVYKGWNRQTQQWEVITALGSEAVAPTTTTAGGRVYKPNPRAGEPGQDDFVLATGIEQPYEGLDRWIDAGGGYVKRQYFRSGEWTDSDNPEDYKPVSPEAVRTAGAIRAKGEEYEVPMTINGKSMLVTVVANGAGGYDIPQNPRARPWPGVPTEKPIVATSNEQEFIVRYDPDTGQYIKERNPNWSPKASADLLRKLSDQATAKGKELYDKIGQNGYTKEQADADFNQWWDTNVEPQRAEVARLQTQETLDANLKIAQENRARETQQANLVSQGINFASGTLYPALQAQAKAAPNPAYDEWVSGMSRAISEGKAGPEINPAAFQYKGYDFNQVLQYGLAQYLQKISPTAAAIASGQQQPSYLQSLAPSANPFDLLNRTRFAPAGLAPPAPSNQGGTIIINQGGTGATQPTAPTYTPTNFPTPDELFNSPLSPLNPANMPTQPSGTPSSYLGNFSL